MSLTSPWSDELAAMLQPAPTYRRLAALPPASSRILPLLRRPLRLALLLGSMLSLAVSGRLTLRLVIGGVVSLGWVPLLQAGSAAVAIAALGRRRLPLLQAIDLYFVGYGPWSLWALAIGGAAAVASPLGAASWMGALWPLATVLIVILWSAVLDFAFFRDGLEMSGGRAAAALALQRVLFWGIAGAYYILWAVTLAYVRDAGGTA
jgi:hypothetical protein